MTLLTISATFRGSPNLFDPEKERTVQALELKLLEANILVDQQRPVLVIVGPYDLKTKQIAAPDHWALHRAGYFDATEDEMNTLRQAGYQLPDWRELTITDLRRLHPMWTSK